MTTASKSRTIENLKDVTPSTLLADEDEFFTLEDLIPVDREAAERSLNRLLAEMDELMRENKWEDAVEISYPVEGKIPELIKYGLETAVRAKAAFALGQLKRFDEAITELSACVQKEPDKFRFHSSLAYTAYNSLYAAMNREIFLRGVARKERIELAHKHFKMAQNLRPGGVTNFYREGMLDKQMERKPAEALPYFEKAVSNWTNMSRDDKEARHQERKNFIKALYQLASCLLKENMAKKALNVIKQCLSEDEKSHYVSPVFKYFALGKVQFHLNCFQEAKDALVFAAQCECLQPKDFVYELLARTYLAMDKPLAALEVIEGVPEGKRRPYYRWTEADIHCALKDFHQARRALLKSQERDSRSRHKTLIRLTKIEYLMRNFDKARGYAAAADRFFQEKWGNRFHEALFWQALIAYRLGEKDKARELALELRAYNPRYPKLGTLIDRIS